MLRSICKQHTTLSEKSIRKLEKIAEGELFQHAPQAAPYGAALKPVRLKDQTSMISFSFLADSSSMPLIAASVSMG